VLGFWCVVFPSTSNSLPRATILASAFPYDLPPQQVGPTFTLPVAPPPPVAWTP
jgi:hypothetical protein